jgi:NADH-quinone oxidoreductase subunit L
MLLLVLGDNFVVMFFGWEGVGLCSYLLIGFWYKDYKKATAGMKAFVVNRVGDWGFICGMALLFWGLGGAWVLREVAVDEAPEQAAGVDYVPDYSARFVAVHKQALSSHGSDAHGADGHGASPPQGEKPHGGGHAFQEPPPQQPPLGTEPLDPRFPRTTRPGAPVRGTIDPATIGARGNGFLTMTSHAGARVYLGVDSLEQLKSLRMEECRGTSEWIEGIPCYATSPFVRRPIPASSHYIALVPGGGAVVSGDGNEVGSILASVKRDQETVIVPIGATLTFREIHDQLVLKDQSGKAFLKDALKSKSVWGIGLVTLACLCFFVGATGKSAQIPLYVWLPDAMAGPTPVSALIHAATMVTAGVYMIARLNFLFGMTPSASGVVALVGALTALFAATMGFFQYDIKKVLAYSTVSQLGFMFIGVGVGAYWVGVFHLMTHAFFKACLFLGSGSVIHGMHHVIHDEVGSQDMRNMGGLRAVMPRTALTYKVACMAITAAPPFLAGFWSKDEILWKAFNSQHTAFVPGWVIFMIGLLAAFGTSFYMWRSYYLTFEGKHAHKAIKTKVHESPQAITLVLTILAFLSAFAGIVFGISSHFTGGIGAGLLPHEPLLEQWLHPVTAHHDARIGDAGYGAMYVLMLISVVGAAGSWALARLRYGADRPADWAEIETRLPGFDLLHNKYYVDEIYQAGVVTPFLKLRLVLAEMDRWIVDGIVNGVAVLSRLASWISGAIDRYLVDGAVNVVAEGTLKAGEKLRGMQTGRVQTYVYGILGGVAVLAIAQYFLG